MNIDSLGNTELKKLIEDFSRKNKLLETQVDGLKKFIQDKQLSNPVSLLELKELKEENTRLKNKIRNLEEQKEILFNKIDSKVLKTL